MKASRLFNVGWFELRDVGAEGDFWPALPKKSCISIKSMPGARPAGIDSYRNESEIRRQREPFYPLRGEP